MKIRKAVITAASRSQRSIPLQTLISSDGRQKSVLEILLEEIASAGIDDVCVVTCPGDEQRYAEACGAQSGRIRFLAQTEPLGYGHAIYRAREFTAGETFLHLVGDHLYVSSPGRSCAQHLVELAESEGCSVSAVQSTKESLLSRFGAVGARRLTGMAGAYRVETVLEKPTPTEAEQTLLVPGLRTGHYLCFFGMHALTPAVMEILGRQLAETTESRTVTLSKALNELTRREQYLAIENAQRRYDLGTPYGLMLAQLALALRGRDRDDVVYQILELVADKDARE